jgi:hypothetical protein
VKQGRHEKKRAAKGSNGLGAGGVGRRRRHPTGRVVLSARVADTVRRDWYIGVTDDRTCPPGEMVQ